MEEQTKPTVLVADDDLFVLRRIEEYLIAWGYHPLLAATKSDVMTYLKTEKPSMMLIDLQFGETDGLELLAELMTRDPESTIAVLTGSGSIDKAVQAIKLGACDFLTKPADKERLRSLISYAVRKDKLRRDLSASLIANGKKQLIGSSVEFQKAMKMLRSVATTDATVLITGESGTGKEMAAQSVHNWSERRDGPFIALNMATLPKDLVESLLFGHEKGSFTGAEKSQLGACEQANGGTLFLDEIGEMDISQQAKLLRFLQERAIQRVGSARMIELNVRIIAATNRNLPERVNQGLFREDLYFRLNVVPVVLPPLRNRQDDIPSLAKAFLAHFANKYNKGVMSLAPDLLKIMVDYSWPGNIRQLENSIERMTIMSTTATIQAEGNSLEFLEKKPVANLHKGAQQMATTHSSIIESDNIDGMSYIDRIEKKAIEDAVIKSQGNVGRAAQMLGMSQATVYRKLKKYRIETQNMTS